MRFDSNERSKDYFFVILKRSEESLFSPPRFFTPLRSVQNDMNIRRLWTATVWSDGEKVSSPVMLRTLAR